MQQPHLEIRVLLVEDDPDDQVLTRAILREVEHVRYTVEVAESLEAA